MLEILPCRILILLISASIFKQAEPNSCNGCQRSSPTSSYSGLNIGKYYMVALKRFPNSFMSIKPNVETDFGPDTIIRTYQTGHYWISDWVGGTPPNPPWIYWKFADSDEQGWYYLKNREDPEGFLTIIDYSEETLCGSQYEAYHENSSNHNEKILALSYVKSLGQSQDHFLFRPKCLNTEERKNNFCQIETKAYENAIIIWQTTRQQLPMSIRAKSQYFGISHCSNSSSQSAASYELEDTYFRFTDNVTLFASIYKFVLRDNVVALKNPELYSKNVELATSTSFFNNGPAILRQEYAITKMMTETAYVQKSSSLSNMESVTTEKEVEVDVGLMWKIFKGGFKEHLKSSYTSMYETTNSSSNRISYEEENEFYFRQSIEIPSCTNYTVHTFVEFNMDFPVDYYVQFKITGIQNGEAMTADEIMQHYMYGMQYLGPYDTYTVRGQQRGMIRANLGVHTSFLGAGVPIKDCEAKFNLS